MRGAVISKRVISKWVWSASVAVFLFGYAANWFRLSSVSACSVSHRIIWRSAVIHLVKSGGARWISDLAGHILALVVSAGFPAEAHSFAGNECERRSSRLVDCAEFGEDSQRRRNARGSRAQDNSQWFPQYVSGCRNTTRGTGQ